MPKELLLSLTTFIANTTILTLYFSAVVLDFRAKAIIHRDGFKIAFSGTAPSSILIFLSPMLPVFMPVGPFSSPIDIGISVAGIIWLTLTRRYCKTDWVSALIVVAVAVVIYTFIMLFITSFLLLLATLLFLP